MTQCKGARRPKKIKWLICPFIGAIAWLYHYILELDKIAEPSILWIIDNQLVFNPMQVPRGQGDIFKLHLLQVHNPQIKTLESTATVSLYFGAAVS